MKPHVADWRSRAYCVRIVATSGLVVRLTAYPRNLTMSNGTVYSVEKGYEFSGFGSTSSMSPASVDLTGILGLGVTRDQLATGVFDSARVYLFATNFLAPIEDEEVLALFTLGKTTLQDERYVSEMMSLVDALNQSVGPIYTAQCQNVWADQTLDGNIIATDRSRCMGPRSAPDGPQMATYKVTGTVTGVTSQYQFQDTARTEADEWFTAGQVRFITGANAGLKPAQLKQSTAGGQIVMHEAAYYPIAIGDQYEMIPGCRKRLGEDCVAKFANGKNFNGFPHIPAPSEYTQVGRGA